MKTKKLIIATTGTLIVGGAAIFIVRKLVKKSQFNHLMLAIYQDQAEQKGELSYLKAFDPALADKRDKAYPVILYKTAKVEEITDAVHKAMKGSLGVKIGTDEQAIYNLYRPIESQQKMAQVAKRYEIKYGKKLLDAITGEMDKNERSQLFAIIAQKPELQYDKS